MWQCRFKVDGHWQRASTKQHKLTTAKREGLSLSSYIRNQIVSVLGNKLDDNEYNKLMIEMMTYLFKMTGKLCRKNLDEVEIKAIKKQSDEQLRLWGYRD